MLIILINLARATERLAKMDAQFAAHKLAYSRLEAVDGRTIGEQERGLVNNFARRFFTRYPLSDNEIGCWLSHRKAMEDLLASNEQAAVIVEDDADLANDFADSLQKIEAENLDFDFIFLHRKFKKCEKFFPCKQISDDLNIGIVGFAHMGAIAYVVSRKGAEKFLKYSPKFIHAVDKQIHRYWANDLSVYGVSRPLVVTQDDGYSYIEETRTQDSRQDRISYEGGNKFIWKIARMLTRFSESLRKHGNFYFYLASARKNLCK